MGYLHATTKDTTMQETSLKRLGRVILICCFQQWRSLTRTQQQQQQTEFIIVFCCPFLLISQAQIFLLFFSNSYSFPGPVVYFDHEVREPRSSPSNLSNIWKRLRSLVHSSRKATKFVSKQCRPQLFYITKTWGNKVTTELKWPR